MMSRFVCLLATAATAVFHDHVPDPVPVGEIITPAPTEKELLRPYAPNPDEVYVPRTMYRFEREVADYMEYACMMKNDILRGGEVHDLSLAEKKLAEKPSLAEVQADAPPPSKKRSDSFRVDLPTGTKQVEDAAGLFAALVEFDDETLAKIQDPASLVESEEMVIYKRPVWRVPPTPEPTEELKIVVPTYAPTIDPACKNFDFAPIDLDGDKEVDLKEFRKFCGRHCGNSKHQCISLFLICDYENQDRRLVEDELYTCIEMLKGNRVCSYEDIHRMANTNGDKAVSSTELINFCADDCGFDYYVCTATVAQIPKRQDGNIDTKYFRRPPIIEERVSCDYVQFTQLDQDHDGYVELEDMMRFCVTKCGNTQADCLEPLAAIMDVYDYNNDGRLSDVEALANPYFCDEEVPIGKAYIHDQAIFPRDESFHEWCYTQCKKPEPRCTQMDEFVTMNLVYDDPPRSGCRIPDFDQLDTDGNNEISFTELSLFYQFTCKKSPEDAALYSRRFIRRINGPQSETGIVKRSDFMYARPGALHLHFHALDINKNNRISQQELSATFGPVFERVCHKWLYPGHEWAADLIVQHGLTYIWNAVAWREPFIREERYKELFLVPQGGWPCLNTEVGVRSVDDLLPEQNALTGFMRMEAPSGPSQLGLEIVR